MRRVLSIITVMFILVLSGCSIFNMSQNDDKFDYLFKNEIVGARTQVYSMSDKDFSDIEDQIDKTNKYLEEDSSKLLIILGINNLMSDLYYINEQYVIIYAYYSMFPDNLDVFNEYKKVALLQNDVLQTYNQGLVKLLDSQFRDEILGEWSETDIEHLEYRKEYYDEEYYELETKDAELKIEFQSSLQNEAYEDEIEEVFLEIVEVKNDIANKLNYNNYFEYSYEEVYNREFNYEDLSAFNNSIKEDLIPAILPIKESITDIEIENPSLYKKISSTSSKSIFETKTYMNDLASFLGGDYLKNYNYFWNEGEYYFGNDSSNEAAFKFNSISNNVLLTYFGPGYYSNLYVFSHEFGHYAAGLEDMTDGSNDNLELAEFQAQSNEYLLLAHMNLNNDDFDFKRITLEKLYSGLTSIFTTTMINEFEYRVYSSDNLTISDLKGMMEEVFNDYNALDIFETISTSSVEDFWQIRSGNNPCYYIAYAVSLVPSIEMYFTAMDDIDSTRNIYDTIMKGQNDLFPVLEEIEFSNPLDTNIIKELVDKIQKMA